MKYSITPATVRAHLIQRPARYLVRQSHAISARAESQNRQQLLYVLMVPTMAMIFNASVFGVALPTIRTEFGLEADVAAWLVTAYTLPFMMLMPLYGRLGDSLGKRNLILLGLLIFNIGTVINMVATDLLWLMVGRTVQGVGISGIAPLSIAIIAERFATGERGQALGTWNSVGPMMGIVAPLVAGYMIDHGGWRTIFIPSLLIGLVAVVTVWLLIPSLRSVKPSFLRTFDWIGVLLLALSVIFFIFYISSRPITGVEALQDWRLLAVAVVSSIAFVWRERGRRDPFLRLGLFRVASLRWASLGAGLRMFTMSGIGFLMPLYLADVHELSASMTGSVLMLNAAALLMTMRLGGQLADRWGSRWPVMIGMSIQAAFMIFFALLPGSASLLFVAAGLLGHGLGAGLSLAALHRTSMSKIAPEQNGQAAGIYSMIRFGGILMGSALGGVLLQQAQLRADSVGAAYQMVFWAFVAAAVLGAAIGSLLPE